MMCCWPLPSNSDVFLAMVQGHGSLWLTNNVQHYYPPVKWHGSGNSTIWRCLSHLETVMFQPAMLANQRVIHSIARLLSWFPRPWIVKMLSSIGGGNMLNEMKAWMNWNWFFFVLEKSCQMVEGWVWEVVQLETWEDQCGHNTTNPKKEFVAHPYWSMSYLFWSAYVSMVNIHSSSHCCVCPQKDCLVPSRHDIFHLQVPLFQGYPAHPERCVLQNLSSLAGQ